MITIKLELASNGVIKTVSDNNYNGAGSKHELRTVYETDNDTDYKNTIRFLYELSDDLGINLGNKYSPTVLNFDLGWGEKYEPTLQQLNDLVKATTANLKELKSWKKEREAAERVNQIIDATKPKDDLPF